MRDAEGNYQQSLVALDTAGYLRPGWPIEEPLGSDFGSPAVGSDGSVYVAECGGPEVGCLVHRLGTDGRELPGWPFEAPSCVVVSPCFFDLEVGSDGTAFLWEQPGGRQLIAIEASGEITPGWPLVLEWEEPEGGRGLWLDVQVGTDGTVFVFGGASLLAFAPDGSPRPGWPVTVPDQSDYLLGSQGTVVVWSLSDLEGELCAQPRRTVFTVLGPDGRTLPGWPRGSKGYASSPVVDADGTVYYVSAVGNVYAHDRRGDVKAGWPVAVPGASVGGWCVPTTPYLAPDGMIYILVDDYGLNSFEITARSPDGRLRPGWPYRSRGQLTRIDSGDTDALRRPEAPAFGPDGTVYVVVFSTDAMRVWAEIVALDREGQLKSGWPYRLPIDPTAGVVPSLSVSPDGRLFVRRGHSPDSFLVALDPDGSVSE